MVFIKVHDEYKRDCLINSNMINSIVLYTCMELYIITININNNSYTYGPRYKTKDEADIKMDELLKLLSKNDESIKELKEIKENIKELKDIFKYMPGISIEYEGIKKDFEKKIELK